MSKPINIIVSGYLNETQLLFNEKYTIPYGIKIICNRYYTISNLKFILCSNGTHQNQFFTSLHIKNKQIVKQNSLIKIDKIKLLPQHPYCYIPKSALSSNKYNHAIFTTTRYQSEQFTYKPCLILFDDKNNSVININNDELSNIQ